MGGLIRKFGILLGGIAALSLISIVVVTTIDVIGRYFFSAPLPAAFEMIQILMAVLLFSGLPLVSARREHVTVGFAEVWFTGLIDKCRQILVHIIGAVFLAAGALFLWHHAARLGKAGEILTFLAVPVAPVIYFGSAMFAVAAVILLALALRHLRHKD